MRRFVDRDGTTWDVVLGRESWGALLALFVPAGEGEVRQTMLASANHEDAMQELNEFDEAALQQLLDRSVSKDEGVR